MRTEDDLRNHYDHLADAASPDRVADRLTTQLNRTTPSRRARSLVLALSTAAAVTAAAVAVPLALRSTPSPEPATPVKDPTWQSWLTVPAPPGAELNRQLLTRDYQLLEFRGADLRCTVVTTRNKIFSVASLKKQLGSISKKTIDVAGRPGHLLQVAAHEQLTLPGAVGLKHRIPYPVLRDRQKPTMVHWEAADGLWAGVSCFRGPFHTEAGMNPGDSQALRLARSIRTENQPLLLPFRIGEIPAGSRITSIQIHKLSSQAEYIVELSDGDSQTGLGSQLQPRRGNAEGKVASRVKGKKFQVTGGNPPGETYVTEPMDQGVDLQIAFLYPQSRWYDGEVVTGIPGPTTWRMRPRAGSGESVMIGTLGKDYIAQIAAYRQDVATAEREARQTASALTIADPRDAGGWYDPSVR